MTTADADPWAWLSEHDEPAPLDPDDVRVTAIVVVHDGARWLPGLLDGLARQTFRPHRTIAVDAASTDASRGLLDAPLAEGTLTAVVAADAGSFATAVQAGLDEAADAGWIWLLHDDAAPAPDALAQLARRAVESGAAAVAPVLLAPRRRGVGSLIAEVGQTVTRGGSLISAEHTGAIDQGQLESARVLGASTCGLLISRAAWEAVDGLNPALPSPVQGIDLGARLTASGGVVLTEPAAKVRHVEASGRGLRAVADDPLVARRAYAMSLTALARGRGGALLPTTLASWTRSAGLLLGKDLDGVDVERRALQEWRASREVRAEAASRFAAVGTDPAVTGLRPTRWAMTRRVADDASTRFTEWLAGFVEPESGLGIDHLTGDDFAGSALEGRRRPWAAWAVVGVVLILAALASARELFVPAALHGPQLLPAPGSLLPGYLSPVAGVAPSAGAPWAGLGWLASWAFLGSVEALVTVLLLGCVPLLFGLSHRFLVEAGGDGRVALAGAALFALTPVLTGAVGRGEVGTVVAMLLVAGFATHLLRAARHGLGWQDAARVGLLLLGLATMTPLLAAVCLLGVLLAGRRAGRPLVLVVLAPALAFVTPWAIQVFQHPGRLLTGIDPLLAPPDAPLWWELLLGRPAGAALPPLWISASVVGVLWLLGLIGALRRPNPAGWALAGAAASGLVAVGLSRLVVTVSPGGWVRPQATEWVLLMLGLLVLAACWGLAGLTDRAREADLGLLQLGTLAAAILAVAAVLLGGTWWVVAGSAGLDRQAVGAFPPFIAKDQARGTSRTLALEADADGDGVRWSIQADEFARLGDGERGLTFAGDDAARALATSVAGRIVAGTLDENIVADLRGLGIGHIWLRGDAGDLRVEISNIPGFGAGAIDGDTATWVVPEGGRVRVVSADTETRVDGEVPAGDAGRTLVLAEPSDARWRVSVGGEELAPVPADRPTFDLGTRAGAVDVELSAGPPWWAWAQLAGLLGLVLMAAPALSTDPGHRHRRGVER